MSGYKRGKRKQHRNTKAIRQSRRNMAGRVFRAVKPPFASASKHWKALSLVPYLVRAEIDPNDGPKGSGYQWVSAQTITGDMRGLWKIQDLKPLRCEIATE